MVEFECKEISIVNTEFGCGVTFSDVKESLLPKATYTEIIDSLGNYVSLQRTYPEDEFDGDYYTIEFSDFEKSGEVEWFEINLTPTAFKMIYRQEVIEIRLDIDNKTYDELKDVLERIVHTRGKVITQEDGR